MPQDDPHHLLQALRRVGERLDAPVGVVGEALRACDPVARRVEGRQKGL
jgi:hypothetical protein